MTNKETKRTEIPEIIMQAAKLRVENRVEELTYFLAPLPSKRAQNLLQKVRNMGASADFAEATYEAYEDCRQITKELDRHCSSEAYYDILSDCELTLAQMKFFTNLAILYYHAKEFVERCNREHDGEPAGMQKYFLEWAEASISTAKLLLASLIVEIPDDETAGALCDKIMHLNGILTSFEEYHADAALR